VPLAETADLVAFRMGSLVYVGTFVIGNSYDYRLVFLLLTLPLLLRWPAQPRVVDNRLNLPLVTVAVVVVALWIGTLSQQLRLADELVSWTLAGLLLLLLVRSAPKISALFQSGRTSR
jgi:hypothetical protein